MEKYYMFLIEQKETRKQWTIKAIYNYKSAVTVCRRRTPLVRAPAGDTARL